MTNDELMQLKAAALAATPGPWFASDWTVDDGANTTTVEARIPEVLGPGQSSIWPDGMRALRIAESEGGEHPIADAAYIAAANPSAILALIDKVESLAAPSAANGAELPELPKPLSIDWPSVHSVALGCGVEDRGIRDRYEAAEYGFEDGVQKAACCVPDVIYDADQMQAYALAAVLAEREAAARVCETQQKLDAINMAVLMGAAAAIRART